MKIIIYFTFILLLFFNCNKCINNNIYGEYIYKDNKNGFKYIAKLNIDSNNIFIYESSIEMNVLQDTGVWKLKCNKLYLHLLPIESYYKFEENKYLNNLVIYDFSNNKLYNTNVTFYKNGDSINYIFLKNSNSYVFDNELIDSIKVEMLGHESCSFKLKQKNGIYKVYLAEKRNRLNIEKPAIIKSDWIYFNNKKFYKIKK